MWSTCTYIIMRQYTYIYICLYIYISRHVSRGPFNIYRVIFVCTQSLLWVISWCMPVSFEGLSFACICTLVSMHTGSLFVRTVFLDVHAVSFDVCKSFLCFFCASFVRLFWCLPVSFAGLCFASVRTPFLMYTVTLSFVRLYECMSIFLYVYHCIW